MVSAVASRCFSYCSRGVEIRNMKLLWPLLSPTGPRNLGLIFSPQSNHTASQASQRQECDDHRSTYSLIEHRKSETGLAACQRRGSLCAPQRQISRSQWLEQWIYRILRTCNSRHSYYKFFSMFKVVGDGLGKVQYEELHRCFKIGPIQVDVVRLR